MLKNGSSYIKYIKEIDYLKSEIEYRDNKFTSITMDFMNNVDDYASSNIPEKYDIKKQQETYDSNKIDEEVIKKHIEDGKKLEKEKHDAKIEAYKNPLPQKFKKLYKKIVLKTHPDKLIDCDEEEKEFYTQLYKNATEAYKAVDAVEIIYIAYDLNVSLPNLDDEELSLFNIKINKLKGVVQHYESTYPWVWFHENDGDRKNFILKTYVDKNY